MGLISRVSSRTYRNMSDLKPCLKQYCHLNESVDLFINTLDGISFCAHKSIAKRKSSKVKKKIEKSPDKLSLTIELKFAVNLEILKSFIKSWYGKQPEVTDDNVDEYLQLAKFFEARKFITKCENFKKNSKAEKQSLFLQPVVSPEVSPNVKDKPNRQYARKSASNKSTDSVSKSMADSGFDLEQVSESEDELKISEISDVENTEIVGEAKGFSDDEPLRKRRKELPGESINAEQFEMAKDKIRETELIIDENGNEVFYYKIQ